MGAQRWISLYAFRFQPSELAKMLFPFFVATYLAQRYGTRSMPTLPFTLFLKPLACLGVTFLLIARQPDLGTALIVLASGIILLWSIGLPRSFFLVAGLLCFASAPVLWKCLKPYQQKRVLSLLGKGSVNKERYQIEQAKIAIGSGGIIGKGYLKGTHNKLAFLPEDHTDFIFAVVCEEWGLLGALLLITLFLALFGRFFFIMLSSHSLVEHTLVMGLSIYLMLSFFINIGMVIGLLPTVGIPLPLFSYGITNLWCALSSLGILNNMAIKRWYF